MALDRVRAQDNMKFEKLYEAWWKYTYDAWSNALKQFNFISILKIIRNLTKYPIFKTLIFKNSYIDQLNNTKV